MLFRSRSTSAATTDLAAARVAGSQTIWSARARRSPSGAPASREVKAAYTRDGNKLQMKWQGFGQTIGTVEGNNFTMDNEGVRFAYRK